MYTFINEFIDSIVNKFNEPIANPIDTFTEIESEFSEKFLPVSIEDKTYIVKFSDIVFSTEEGTNKKFLLVSGYLETFFQIVGTSIDHYKNIINLYLYILFIQLLNFTLYSAYNTNKFIIIDIEELSLTDLDTVSDDGEFLMPKLNFTFKILPK
jgi:hypothetical protein